MPSAIPDRFKLELRLGRDEDIEEWLATDVSLDRPVLLRSLGPESTVERRQQFFDSVSGVAAVAHSHLTRVYMVEKVHGGAYAVLEWAGGSSLADHVEAGTTMDLGEFLPNASGLAGALAALHERGLVHGGIDLSAVSYSVAHPAKLSAFGRVPRGDETGDVRALSTALETTLTGSPPGGPAPSQRVDGVTPQIDNILRSSQRGQMDARSMEKALAAAPTPRDPISVPRQASRRLIIAALTLAAMAVGMVVLGLILSGDSTEPVLPPRQPAATTTIPTTTTTTVPAPGQVRILSVIVIHADSEVDIGDPEAGLVIDGNTATSWSTGTFDTPLSETGDGVGLAVSITGTPGRVEFLEMPTGTVFELRWASTLLPEPDDWQTVARAESSPGVTAISLPSRSDGHWLIWLTDLPENDDGTFESSIAEVRFLP